MLIGNKVILRPLKIEDLPKVNQWRNDLELIKLTQGIRFPKTKEMDEEWFNDVLRDKSNKNIYFGIDDKESEEFIGIISLNNIDYISGIASWGLIIGDINYRCKGYSKEITNLFFDYAFNMLNLRKLWGYMIEGNEGAKKMHERLGSIYEGVLKKHIFYDGKFNDVYIVSIFHDSFK